MSAEASSESVSPEAAIRAAYAQRLIEVANGFGPPTVRQESLGSFIAGLSFARLEDFGANRDFLILAYYDPALDDPARPGGMPSAYRLEVWDAGSDGSSMQLLLDGSVSPMGQNYYCAGVSLGQEGDRCYLLQMEANEGSPPSTVAYGLLNDGSFGKAEGAQIDYASSVEAVPVSRMNTGIGDLEQHAEHALEVFDLLGVPRPATDPREAGTASGWYVAVLVPEEMVQPTFYVTTVSDVSLDGDVLKLYGSLAYDPDGVGPYDFVSCDAFGPKHWAFTLSDSTKFLAAGGTAGPREMAKDDLVAVAASLNGLGLKLEVADGQVVTVALSS